MRNKIIVHNVEKKTTDEFKNLKCVARAYPMIEYHQIYQLWLQHTGRTKRKQQPNNDISRLSKLLFIYDNIKPLNTEPLAAAQ